MSDLTWPPANNQPAPNSDRAAWFNRELLAIGGMVNGVPRLRLIWGQSLRERDRKIGSPGFHDGDDLRYPAFYREVHDGWLAHFPDGDRTYPPTAEPPDVGVIVERILREYAIGIPRYMVELWRAHTSLDAATYDPYLPHPDTGERVLVDSEDMGPGQYSRAFYTLITEHRGGCCGRSKRAGYRACFAEYREPAQVDLDYVASLWRQKEREPATFAQTEVIPPTILENRIAARLNQIKDKEQRSRASLRLRLRSTLKDSAHVLFDAGRVGYQPPAKP